MPANYQHCKAQTALAVSELLQPYLDHSENTAKTPKQSKTHVVRCCQQHVHNMLLCLQLQPA
jgi:hypothetical protein